MKTIDFSYFIERFNAGDMDEAEEKWFRKELDENDKLRQEVELRSRTDTILKNQDLLNLRNKLNTIEKKRKETIHDKKPRGRLNIKYAAAIAGLIIVASIGLLTNRKMTNDEIMEHYYMPYEAESSLRSGESSSNLDFSLALEYYNIHDYRNAAIYFRKVLQNEPGNMQSALLNGISNFEIQNYPEASGSFRKVIDDNNSFYIDHAQWYLALCYIKTDEMEKAVEQLAIIEKSRTIYRKRAGKILKCLN